MDTTSKGFVTTARGQLLNMDELIAQSKRPLNFKDKKSEIKKRDIPNQAAEHAFGFKPETGSAKVISFENAEKVNTEQKVNEGETLAELTGITIDKTKHIKVKDGATVKKGDGVNYANNEALNDILSDLEQSSPKAQEAAVKDDNIEEDAEKQAPKTRTRRTTKKTAS